MRAFIERGVRRKVSEKKVSEERCQKKGVKGKVPEERCQERNIRRELSGILCISISYKFVPLGEFV